jgi:homoserine kinase
VPQTQLATQTARAVLPPVVDHVAAAANSGRAALLVEALSRRPDLLLPATRDWLHQEFRRSAFPDSMRLVDVLRADGHAAVISGAGPSIVVLTTRERAAAVQVPDGPGAAGWRRLEPGVPAGGVEVVRR